MKNKNKLLATFLCLSCFFTSSLVKGQTTPPAAATPAPAAVTSAPEAPSPWKITANLVTSYIWRGTVSSPTPNFQPTFSYTAGPLEIGVWGSTDFIGKYKELDLYATLSEGPLKFTVTDYDFYFASLVNGNLIQYFNYSNTSSNPSGHIFEGSVTYSGPSSFPLSVNVNVMFAGNDYLYDASKPINPATGITQDISKQAYSTYIEFDYTFKYVSPFLGITPSQGYYGDSYNGKGGFGVCNLGLTATKNLKITEAYSLPLTATLGFNPQLENAYCVFGITF
jgi:hypothetical protein